MPPRPAATELRTVHEKRDNQIWAHRRQNRQHRIEPGKVLADQRSNHCLSSVKTKNHPSVGKINSLPPAPTGVKNMAKPVIFNLGAIETPTVMLGLPVVIELLPTFETGDEYFVPAEGRLAAPSRWRRWCDHARDEYF
jgi:hypothetical protein